MSAGRLAGGALISTEGDILPSGHVVAAADQECQVHLADGRTVKGRTRGIYRDLDLGMVQINEAGEYPFLDRGDAREVPQNQLYVGFAHQKKLDPAAKPAAHIVGIRRVFRGMVWTDFELENHAAGTPLLNREGRVIGVLAKRSEFGGFLFARLEQFDAHINRLKNGEVYGAWYPGLGPMFGIEVQSTREGAKVLEVFANSPAAAVKLQAGDIVTRVDGKPVVSLEDIYFALGEKNAGQEAQLEFVRGGQTQSVKLLLSPRTP
jgi:serine protease Do